MLVESPWTKPKQWFARSAYARRCLNPPSNWQYDETTLNHRPIELQTVVPDLDERGLPKVRCTVLEYCEINPEVMDGAKIFMRPGSFTPPQYVETDHTFIETPLQGRIIFLGVNREGKLVKHFFETDQHENATHAPVARQGEIMRIFACRNQGYVPSEFVKTFWPNEPIPNAEVLENVRPGFASAKLVTVPDGAVRIGSTDIPKEFWETCDMLKQGQEEEIIRRILRGETN